MTRPIAPGQTVPIPFTLSETPDSTPTVAVYQSTAAGVLSDVSATTGPAVTLLSGLAYHAYFTVPAAAVHGSAYRLLVTVVIGGETTTHWLDGGTVESWSHQGEGWGYKTVYYVRTDGSDANNGLSPASAKLTFASARALAVSGDLVVCIGQFNETFTLKDGVDVYFGPHSGITRTGSTDACLTDGGTSVNCRVFGDGTFIHTVAGGKALHVLGSASRVIAEADRFETTATDTSPTSIAIAQSSFTNTLVVKARLIRSANYDAATLCNADVDADVIESTATAATGNALEIYANTRVRARILRAVNGSVVQILSTGILSLDCQLIEATGEGAGVSCAQFGAYGFIRGAVFKTDTGNHITVADGATCRVIGSVYSTDKVSGAVETELWASQASVDAVAEDVAGIPKAGSIHRYTNANTGRTADVTIAEVP